jgi:alpha-tubulin suppressor-like RCC1 family protein
LRADHDSTANISFYDTGFVLSPVLYKDDVLCTGSGCNLTGFEDGFVNFTVSSFSNYTLGANSRLEVWDGADEKGGSNTYGVGEYVPFFANYTNSSSGLAISSGSCSVRFNERSWSDYYSMSYNSSSSLFEYLQNFSSGGVIPWEVSCTNTVGFENLSDSDEYVGMSVGSVGIIPSPQASVSQNLVGYCSAVGNENVTRFDYEWSRNGTVEYMGSYFKEGSISTGFSHSCGIRANDSRVLCWGSNNVGELGVGNTTTPITVPVLTTDSSAYSSVSVGGSHSCGVRVNDSRVLCWGYNLYGRLGIGNTTTTMLSPVLTVDTSAYGSVSTGTEHSCGIRVNDSRVLCWGYNFNGELGIGNTTNMLSPVLTVDSNAYMSIQSGSNHNCGVRANDSRVLCWGNNDLGGLGVGNTTTPITVPVLTSDSSAFLSVSAGGSHSCGVRANDSRVLCWGYNANGQLGVGNTTSPIMVPVLTVDSSAFLSVSAGGNRNCGVRLNDSRVLCWGYNANGQLGVGNTTTPITVPVLTVDDSAYSSVSTGFSHSCGIRANDSRVLCWGYNTNGQLGVGNTTSPILVPVLTTDTSSYYSGFYTDTEYNISTLQSGFTSLNDNWTLSCRAVFGSEMTSYVESSITTITNNIPISTCLELQDMWDNLSGSYYLTQNIDCSDTINWNDAEGWLPVGNDTTAYRFSGTLDGQGYNISGLFINRSSTDYQGLFGMIESGTEIRDVGLVNANITGNLNVGSIVGYMDGGSIVSSYSTGTVITGSYSVGGLIGALWNGSVANSYYDYNSSTINGLNAIGAGAIYDEDFNAWIVSGKEPFNANTYLSYESGYYLINSLDDFRKLLLLGQNENYSFRLAENIDMSSENDFYIPYMAGLLDGDGYNISGLNVSLDFASGVGLFGYMHNSSVSGLGLLDAAIAAYDMVGGIAGTMEGASTIHNSYIMNSAISGSWGVGGIAGLMESGSSVSSSYSSGTNVTGTWRVGGVAGVVIGSSISSSYASGNVYGISTRIGGLTGYIGADANVSDSYSTSNVYAIGSSTGQHHGGFVGQQYRGIVVNSYSSGTVNSTHSDSGGFAGSVDTGGSYTMTANFWDNQTSGKSTSAGDNVTGLTTEQMYNISNFLVVNWNISEISDYNDETWFIDDGNDYPRLWFEYEEPGLQCGIISSPGNYVMESNLTAAGTCFTINVSDVSLDCQGHTINYSTADEGYGILIWSQSANVNNVNISNCNIVKDSSGGASSSVRPAILGYGRNAVPSGSISNSAGTPLFADNVNIHNVTLNITGDFSAGIYGTNSRYWNITGSSIHTLSVASPSVYGYNSTSWTLSDINIINEDSSSYGISGPYSDHWIINNVSITNLESTAYAIYGFHSQAWTLSGIFVNNSGVSAHGIYAENSPLWIINDSRIYTSATLSKGIYGYISHFWKVSATNVSTTNSNSQGIYVEMSDGWNVSNSIISAASSADIHLKMDNSARRISVVNTSFDRTSITFHDDNAGWIDVGWWAYGYVNDTMSNSLEGANVSWADAGALASNPSIAGYNITGSTGYTPVFSLFEFSENHTGRYYHSNYSFNATMAGYDHNDTVTLNATDNSMVAITLGLEVPVVDNAIIESTSGNNLSADNLTLSYDVSYSGGETIYNVTDWRLEGSSIALVNAPMTTAFVNSSHAYDISSYSHVVERMGTIGHNSSGGLFGNGAFYNDRTNLAYVRASGDYNQTAFTYMGWFSQGDSTAGNTHLGAVRLVQTSPMRCETDGGWKLSFDGATDRYAIDWCPTGSTDAGGNIRLQGATGIDRGWKHIAVTFDGNGNVTMYINGTVYATQASNGIIYGGSDTRLMIGAQANGYNTFDGHFNLISYYGRAISAQQIASIYSEQSQAGSINKIVSQETQQGETWQSAVWSFYGGIRSIMALSNTITLESAPNITIISPENNYYQNSSSVLFNVSSDKELSWCGLSVDGGANISMTHAGDGMGAYYTNSSMPDAQYSWIVYCNDTFGNMGISDLQAFTVDTIPPQITVTYPENVTYNVLTHDLNYTYSELNCDIVWWGDGTVNSSTQACGLNWSGLSASVGANNWTVWIRDLAGNLNSSSVTFEVDIGLQCGVLSSPGEYVLDGNVSSAGTCFTINVSDVSLDCQGHTINYSASDEEGYGILIWSQSANVNNVSISNCNIVKDSTGGSSSSHRPAILGYGNNDTPSGNLPYSGAILYIDYVTLSNVNISTIGSFSRGIAGVYGRHWNISGSYVSTSGSESHGVLGRESNYWILSNISSVTSGLNANGIYGLSSSSWSLSNVSTQTSNSAAYGVYGYYANSWIISGMNIGTSGSNAWGLYLRSARDWIISDSIINATASEDVYMRLDNAAWRTKIVNVTYNRSDVGFHDEISGWLDEGYWFTAYINDSVGNPLSNASVIYADAGFIAANPTSLGYSITGSNGYTDRFALYAYSRNQTHSFNNNNYTLYADAAGYYPSNSVSLNVTDNVDDLFFTLLDGYFPVCVVETGYCFGTIQQAIDNASSGMTVMITDNATYTDNVLINKSLILSHNSTIGSPTILSSNTAVTITSSNVRLHCNGMTIRYSYSYEGYGILIWSELAKVENVDISDCNIIKDSAGGSSSSYRPAILGYGLSITPVGTHPNSVGTLYYVDYVNISNVNVTVTGPYSRGVHGVYSRYWNVSGLIVTTSDDYSHGIYGLSSSSWSVSDVNITTYGSSAYGIYGYYATSWILSRLNISTADAEGVYVRTSDGWIISDSIINAATGEDVYVRLDNPSWRVKLVNTSHNASTAVFHDSDSGWLDVGYWVTGYVNDTDGVALGGVNVSWVDSGALASNPSKSGFNLTSSSGYTDRIPIYTISRNQTHNFSHNNYTFNANKDEISDELVYNITGNTKLNFTLDMPLDCGILSNPGTYYLNNSVSSAGTCFTINVSDVSLDCQGHTINYSTAEEGCGILIWSQSANVNNVNVSNCNIVKDSSGGNSTSYRPAIVGYGHSLVPSGTMVDDGGTIYYVDNVNVTNVSISTFGDYSFGIYGVRARYWNISGLNISTSGSYAHGVNAYSIATLWSVSDASIITSGSNARGIYSRVSSAWSLSDINVSTSGSSAYGIYGEWLSTSWLLSRINISTSGVSARGLQVQNTDGWIVQDSIVRSLSSYDVYLRLDNSARRVGLINTSYDSSSVYFYDASAGWLDVGYWVSGYVNDSDGVPLGNASIFYSDSGLLSSNPSGLGYSVTGSDGYTDRFALYAYSRNQTHTFGNNNYSLYADASGYYPSEIVNLNVSDNDDGLFFTLIEGKNPVCVVESGYCFGGIQEAVDNASSGMTVMITDNATYSGSFIINKSLILSHNNTLGSPLIVSTGTAFTITSSDVSLHCNGMTIKYSDSIEGYGILIWSQFSKVERVNISDCNIIKDSTGGFSASRRPAILGFGYSEAPTGSISSTAGTLYYTDYVNVNNVNISMSGEYGSGIYGVRSRYWNISGLNVSTSGSYSYGVYGTYSNSWSLSKMSIITSDYYSSGIYGHASSSWILSDSNINTSGRFGTGIYSSYASSWSLSDINISTIGLDARGLHIQDTDDWFVSNSIVNSSASYDVYLRQENSARRIRFVNTTFNSSSVLFYDANAGWLDVGYWASGYVNDSDGLPLEGASILYADSGLLSSNPSNLGYSVTGYDGFTDRFALYAYSRNLTHSFNNNNYSLYADASGYYPSEIVYLNVSDNVDGLFFTLVGGNYPVCVVESGYCFGGIQEAVDNASSGMTVMITDNATYSGSFIINNSLSLTHNSTVGSPTIVSSGTAITITSSDVGLRCNGMTIKYSDSVEGYGILIWSQYAKVEDVDIRDCNIIKDSTGGSSSSYRPAILGYGYSNAPGGTLPLGTGTLYTDYVNISNVTISTVGSYARGIYGIRARYWNITGLIVSTTGFSSYGVMGHVSSSWIVSDANITTFGSSGNGVHGSYSSFWSLSGLNISTIGTSAHAIASDSSTSWRVSNLIVSTSSADSRGISLTSSNDWIVTDSDIEDSGGYDVYLRLNNASFRAGLINTSYNSSDVFFYDSVAGWLDVGYWVTAYASYTSGFPLSDANVSWNDVGILESNPSKTGFNMTSGSGFTDRIPIYVLSMNQTHNISHNNYSFNADKDGIWSELTYDVKDNVQLNFTFDMPSDCGILSKPGEYVLDGNVSSPGTCFIIDSSHVTLDCQGYSIAYGSAEAGSGIIINGGTTNITIDSCHLHNASITSLTRAVYFNTTKELGISDLSLSNLMLNLTAGSGIISPEYSSDTSTFYVYEDVAMSNISMIGSSASAQLPLRLSKIRRAAIDSVYIDVMVGPGFRCSYCGFLNLTNSSITFNHSYGIDWFNSGNIFAHNVSLVNNGSNSASAIQARGGIYTLDSLLINLTDPVGTNQIGIRFEHSSVRNSVITSSRIISGTDAYDIRFTGTDTETSIYFINTTLNRSKVNWENAHTMHRGWFVDVNVKDEHDEPVESATIIFNDNGLGMNPATIKSGLTDDQGDLKNHIAYEYSATAGEYTHYNNYTIIAGKEGYGIVTKSENITGNIGLQYVLTSGPQTVCILESGLCYYTIQNAVDMADAGNTVVITDDSIYFGSVTISKPLILTHNSTLGAPTIFSSGTALTITSSNVSLDCNGMNIRYSESLEGYGILIWSQSENVNNVTVRDCNIVKDSTGGNTNSRRPAILGYGRSARFLVVVLVLVLVLCFLLIM